MNLWILSLSHLLHVLGTVVWIGGIFMTLCVILPSTKAALESSPVVGEIMKEVTQRFTPMANISILILIGTGITIFNFDKNFTSFLDFHKTWNMVVYIKLLLVCVMILIHFYRGLILTPKIVKSSTQANVTHTAKLKKFSLDLVKTNFVLGIIVLVFAAVSISL
jgi:uncharacterized membrane protein